VAFSTVDYYSILTARFDAVFIVYVRLDWL
jgi:hypothetical protein